MFDSIAKTVTSFNVVKQLDGRTSVLPVMYVYLLIVLAGLLSSKALFAANIVVNDVRVGKTAEYTRLTFESKLPIQYALSMLDKPGRVVIDLERVALTPVMESLSNKINVTDPFIEKVRLGRFKPHVLRLVLDLKTAVAPRAFVLEPSGSSGYRLVVDIYQIGKVAPIDVAQNDSDPLGTFVSKLKKPVAPETKHLGTRESKVLKVAKYRKPTQARAIIVAIDAGHGGKDPGALGPRGTREKDVTLAIARKLKARIDNEPNMRAVLVRDGDYYVALDKRRDIARREKADLFVSVHADAFHKQHARGSSVFTLSQRGATSTAAGWLAKKENSVDRKWIGGVDIDDKTNELKKIILDLSLSATINDSVKLGEHVLAEIGDINHLHKPQVEQAGFAVLKSPDIPSILVETAFLSNPDEERKLKSGIYQNKMADALFAGIKRYFSTNPALARSLISAK